MTFFTSSDTKRPIRLSKETRQWAWESMHGKYGDEAMANPNISVELKNGNISERELCSIYIRSIAENAPLRICPFEQISGAATLGDAIGHCIPAKHENITLFGVSHLTVNFERTVREGISSYEKEIDEEIAKPETTDEERDYLGFLLHALKSYHIWHRRYLSALKNTKPEIYERLLQVPFSPARDFKEAVQAIWFQFAFMRLCGNWPGLGRLDVIWGDYLKKDLKEKKITLPEAREFLASLFIKGCEWIQSDTPPASGDAQHYQNIILGGTDEKGFDVTNEVTYLILDIVEELGISDFPISVRLHKNTPEKLLRKCAAVVRHGGGIVAFYSEETVYNSMIKAGYPESEVYKFANDGCWETQIPGETDFEYMPFDSLQIFDRAIGYNSENPPVFSDFEELYSAFLRELRKEITDIFNFHIKNRFVLKDGKWTRVGWYVSTTPLIDIFEKGCIEKKRSYFNLGPVYTVRSPHIGGAPDAANSLNAVNELVFKRKLISYKELFELIKNNWEGAEALRQFTKNKITYYGNNDSLADSYYVRIIEDFARIVKEVQSEYPEAPLKFVPGISTFGRQITWLDMRHATFFGSKCGEILSPNASPTPGTDVLGVTAQIESYCKADLEKTTTGAALDVRIFPDTISGEDGIDTLCELFKGFMRLGGYFMQIDSVNKKVLLEARKHPEDYKTLSVRVSGWNARFVTLDKNWQDMIIERQPEN